MGIRFTTVIIIAVNYLVSTELYDKLSRNEFDYYF